MSSSRRWLFSAAALLAVGVVPPAVRADTFRDVALGLGFAGFNIEGDRNLLSGGADLLVNHDFAGTPLDFGIWDLTLQGPVSLQVSTGRRGLSTFDISFRTALTGNGVAQPLNYVLNYDVGAQSTSVSGSLLLDAAFSLNGLGFYDLDLTYSSRQEVDQAGWFADGTDVFDLDVGPTRISGNVIADVLAVVTAPLFELTGQANWFEPFSGRAQLEEAMRASAARTRNMLAAGGDPAADTLATADFVPADGPLPLSSVAFPAAELADAAARRFGRGTVPEPTVALLMLLGLPALFIRRRRRANR